MNLSRPRTKIRALAALLALSLPAALLGVGSGTATLPPNSTFSFDTGSVGSGSSGDIAWSGSTLTTQGTAGIVYLGPGGSAVYAGITLATLQQGAAGYSNLPWASNLLPVNTVLEVHTNGGNYAKLLVTANSGSSLAFQYTTYASATTGGGGTTSANAPAVTEVQNNYSYISPGLPNYGIAPGSLFIVKGTNLNGMPLSSLQSSAAPGLPTTFNGASISVTVGGTTVTPGIYYTSPTQLAAVLPSTTPVGTGTITVTNNGVTSATTQMIVVPSALGLDVATDANYNFFSTSSSASPGEAIILWGSGVGADTANTDLVYPLKQDNLTNIPMTVYVGGISATIAYRGRSQFPGVDQVVVTIPSGVPIGCSVSIVAVSGSIVSNSITIPVAQGGGACSDPTSALTPAQQQTLSGKSTVAFGEVSVLKFTEATTVSDTASAIFYRYPTAAIVSAESNANIPSIGSCVVLTTAGAGTEPTGLDAGTLTLTGTPGTVPLPGLSGYPGLYEATLPASAIPASGGSYTFTGTGGKDVGAFSTTLNFPAPLVWTNSSITTVNRAQGQTVNWTGGASNSYVQIEGQSTLGSGASLVSATFICYAPIGPGQFTVPSWVLLALPANPQGSMSVANQTNPQTFSASGLDYAYAVATSITDVGVAYQ
jgi:uncharacterized protein (TIGR03437 family)